MTDSLIFLRRLTNTIIANQSTAMNFVVWDEQNKRFTHHKMEDSNRDVADYVESTDLAIAELMKAITELRRDFNDDYNKTHRLQVDMEIAMGRLEEKIMDLDHGRAESKEVADELRKRLDRQKKQLADSFNRQADRVTALEIAAAQRAREGYKVADSTEVITPDNVLSNVADIKSDLSDLKTCIGNLMGSLEVDRINEVNLLLSRFETKLESVARIELEWGSLQNWVKAEISTLNIAMATMRAQLTPEGKKTVGRNAQFAK